MSISCLENAGRQGALGPAYIPNGPPYAITDRRPLVESPFALLPPKPTPLHNLVIPSPIHIMFNSRTGARTRPWCLILSLLLWTVSSLADDRKCYNPDSSQATADVPCTDEDNTFCCNKGDICMSNGLCYLQQSSGFALSRPSCTDLSWSACGSYKYCCKSSPAEKS